MKVKVVKVVNTLVKTDNKTFVAMAGCIDDAIYLWSIIMVIISPNKKVHGSTLKTLQITKATMQESTKNKIKPGRTSITKGTCPAGGVGGGGVGEGIKGLLGG